jgi:hypothetical protein
MMALSGNFYLYLCHLKTKSDLKSPTQLYDLNHLLGHWAVGSHTCL